MATFSKALNGSHAGAPKQSAYLEMELVSQDVANNRSTLRYRAYLKSNASGSSGYTNGIGKYTISGASSASGNNQTWSWTYSTLDLIKDWTSFTVNHNSDGTVAIQQIQLYVYVGPSLGSATVVGSLSVPTIARASKPRLSTTSVNYGSAVTIYTDRASTAFTHTIRANWNGTTSTIASSVTTSFAWTVPNSYMSRIPNATSTSGTIYLDTYSGSTLIGTKTVVLTTVVPSSIVPSTTGVSISEYVSGMATKFGAYIQNKSRLSISITASGAYSSTIKSYSIVGNGESFNSSSATTGYLRNSGSNVFTLKVTDSRGRIATTTRTVSVSAYNNPEITSFDVYRCNSDGTANASGTYIRANYQATVTSLNAKNSKGYTLQYRTGSGSWTSVTLDNSSYTPNTYRVLSGFSASSSYEFQLVITDYFGSATAQSTISTSFVTLDFRAGGRGVAIGKVSERNGFEVGIDTDFYGVMRNNGHEVVKRDGKIDIFDTRSENTPSQDGDLKGVKWHFKENTADGLNDGGTYHSVCHIQPWLDGSGGAAYQMAFTQNGGIYLRKAIIGNAWGIWVPVVMGNTGSTPDTAIYIAANSNLNSYTTPGYYYQSSSQNAATIANVPAQVGFSLHILRNVGVSQIFYRYDTGTKFYMRRYYNGSWGEWSTYNAG